MSVFVCDCLQLSVFVCNCLRLSQDFVCSVCNCLALIAFELFSFSISLPQHKTAMSIASTHATPWQNWTDGCGLLLSGDRVVLLLLVVAVVSSFRLCNSSAWAHFSKKRKSINNMGKNKTKKTKKLPLQGNKVKKEPGSVPRNFQVDCHRFDLPSRG